MISSDVHDAVRHAVRAMLVESPAYAAAGPEERRSIANKLVKVGLVAARLLEVDDRLTREINGQPAERPADGSYHDASTEPAATPVATGLSASDQLGMRAVGQAGNTVRSLRDSIGFPEFVQSLITGTFQAILTSSTMQLGALGELLDNVSASASDFEATIPDNDVRSWAVQRFPFLRITEGTVDMADPEAEIHDHDAQLKGALSASDDEIASIDGSDIEGTLLPLVRRKMGRDRQGILATLVQLGLQRIVVDDGRLEASMDLRVDAQSSSQEDQQALDSLGVNAGASGSFGIGPWGASVQASTSVGRVRSDHQLTEEQIAARAGLRSSVQLAFRTEQVPLDRMADASARVRIAQNARVPDVAERSILGTTRDVSGPIAGPSVASPPAIPTLRPPTPGTGTGAPGAGAASQPTPSARPATQPATPAAQPAARQPAAPQPAATQPAQPAAPQPAASQPAATQPAQPAAPQPAATQPAQPAAPQPVAPQPH